MLLLDTAILTQKERTLAVEMLRRFAPVSSPKYCLRTRKRQWQFFYVMSLPL